MLTFLPLGRIDAIQADMQHDTYQPNTAQRLLAEEVIRFVHGEEGLSAALSATQVQCLCASFTPSSPPPRPPSFSQDDYGVHVSYVQSVTVTPSLLALRLRLSGR